MATASPTAVPATVSRPELEVKETDSNARRSSFSIVIRPSLHENWQATFRRQSKPLGLSTRSGAIAFGVFQNETRDLSNCGLIQHLCADYQQCAENRNVMQEYSPA